MGLAARGSRNLDRGEEAIEDEVEMAQVRRQARRVYLKSAVAAIGLTALSVAIPSMSYEP